MFCLKRYLGSQQRNFIIIYLTGLRVKCLEYYLFLTSDLNIEIKNVVLKMLNN